MLVTPCAEIMTSESLFQNTFVLNWPRVVNFADIIKIAIIVIKTTFKASKKLKEVENIY